MRLIGKILGGLVALGVWAAPVQADLYGAVDAYEKKDFARAFELYRELAELGQIDAQENLAFMYVGGEGVKRDNVLGYAWASIVLEQRPGDANMKGIVDQLDRHMTPAARVQVAELKAKYGVAGINTRLLPELASADHSDPTPNCKVKRPANPDDFFPEDGIERGLSGAAIVQIDIHPDGRTRFPRVWFGSPLGVFENATARVAMHGLYAAPPGTGTGATCSLRVRVVFKIRGGGSDEVFARMAEAARVGAAKGDPRALLLRAVFIATHPDLRQEGEAEVSQFIRAAQAGVPTAQYLLGRMSLTGYMLKQDVDKALFWLRKAAAADQVDAQFTLANYLLTQPGAPAADEAFALLARAAATGHMESVLLLAANHAAAPDAARRDPRRALAAIEGKFREISLLPLAFEIRAAAKAMLGDFAGAQKDQESAVSKAKSFDWDLAPHRERLAAYTAGKAWTGTLFEF
jgi:hypothetical protein